MYDLLIIGSGSAGLSAAVYAAREMLNFAVIEKNYMGVGQISESERVDNYPGLYGENGFDLGVKFRAHAESLGTEFITAEVLKISKIGDIFEISLGGGKRLESKTVIYCAGAAPRRLNIEGEAEFAGRGVSYCAVCDAAFYKGKTVAVIGGGDTALSDALLLSKLANKVYLVHRRDTFRAGRQLQDKLSRAQSVSLILNSVPVKIIGDKKVSQLVVSDGSAETALSVDGVFAAVGRLPNTAPVSGLVELEGGYIPADENGVTSCAGFFAAGDVRTKRLRQVVTAASDGANCVFSAQNYLDNQKPSR